ncbi:MAG: protein PhnA [Paraglaciecola psychrophila]|jgi:protein PhnA
MSIEDDLLQRADSSCELCNADKSLAVYGVAPFAEASADSSVLLCEICRQQIAQPEAVDARHWRVLSDTMWSTVPAVQVMAWRQLTLLSSESWAQDLLDMLYLEEEVLAWAEAGLESDESDADATVDSNGAILQAGDTVTLIKDLAVKGAGFTAKRGTAVRGISLTSDPSQIEGRVNGTRIVLLTQYLKKSN